MFGLEWYDYLFLPWTVNKAIYNALRHRQRTPDIAGRVPQTAAYSRALPLVYGRTRLTANVIQAVDLFDQTGGSEPKGNRLDVLLALCEGPIVGVDRVWIDKTVFHLLPTGGVTPPAADSWVADVKFGYGTPGRGGTQTLNFWQSQFPTRNWALLYPGVAFLARREYVAGAAALSLMSFEVKGILDATGDATNGDAHPADILKGSVATPASSMLCNVDYGARFPFTVDTDLGPDGGTGRDVAGVADTSYRRYTTAEGLWLSPAWTERKAASDCLKDVLEATNATCLWTSGLLKILPLGDTSVTGNSVTYTPPTTIQYALTKDDFVKRSDGSRVELQLAPPNDVFNIAPVEFLERAPTSATNDPAIAYQRSLVEDPDPVDSLSTRGELRGPTVTMDAICQRPIALKVSRIRAQRSVAARNRYRFGLPWRFARLQPLDFVSITDDLLGISELVVRIDTIKEKRSTYDLEITAVEWPFGSGFAVAHTTQSSDSPGGASLGNDPETRLHENALRNLTARTIPNGVYRAAAWNGSVFCAVGTNVCATGDGITWTARTIPAGDYFAVVWNGSVFCAVGNGVAATSPDGITWTARTIQNHPWYGLTWDGTVFVAVGGDGIGGYCSTSPTGTAWTAQTMSGGIFKAVAASLDGATLVAVGATGTPTARCTRSTDHGVTWVVQTFDSGAYSYNSILATTAYFIAFAGSKASRSLDGANWTTITLPTASGTVSYDAALWTGRIVAAFDADAGAPGRVLISRDEGGTWILQETFVPHTDYTGACWNGRAAAAVGTNRCATSLLV